MGDEGGEGGEIMGLQGNVAVKDEAEALVQSAIDTYGCLDILVNNAGIMDRNHGVGALSDDMWRRVLQVNLDEPMVAMRKAIPVMLEQGGGRSSMSAPPRP